MYSMQVDFLVNSLVLIWNLKIFTNLIWRRSGLSTCPNWDHEKKMATEVHVSFSFFELISWYRVWNWIKLFTNFPIRPVCITCRLSRCYKNYIRWKSQIWPSSPPSNIKLKNCIYRVFIQQKIFYSKEITQCDAYTL